SRRFRRGDPRCCRSFANHRYAWGPSWFAASVPIPKFATTLQHAPRRTSESKDTSKSVILVPLLNPKFATYPAARLGELRVRGTRATRLGPYSFKTVYAPWRNHFRFNRIASELYLPCRGIIGLVGCRSRVADTRLLVIRVRRVLSHASVAS